MRHYQIDFIVQMSRALSLRVPWCMNKSRPSHFIIKEVGDNTLSLKPMKSGSENVQIYKKSAVSLSNINPEGALEAYIHFLNKADAVGVQSLLIMNKSFSINKPMNITGYEILSSKKLTMLTPF